VKVWELGDTPIHYQREAAVIISAEWLAKVKLAQKLKAQPMFAVGFD
jgi:hypothetical protein